MASFPSPAQPALIETTDPLQLEHGAFIEGERTGVRDIAAPSPQVILAKALKKTKHTVTRDVRSSIEKALAFALENAGEQLPESLSEKLTRMERHTKMDLYNSSYFLLLNELESQCPGVLEKLVSTASLPVCRQNPSFYHAVVELLRATKQQIALTK